MLRQDRPLLNNQSKSAQTVKDFYGSAVRPAQTLLATVRPGKANFLPSRDGIAQIAIGLWRKSLVCPAKST
jgi:hypothetical protein